HAWRRCLVSGGQPGLPAGLRAMPHSARHAGRRHAGPRPDARGQPSVAGGGHVAQQPRLARRLDRRQPAHQAGQRHAIVRSIVRRTVARRHPLPGKPAMTPDTPTDTLPSALPRPAGEREQLERVWQRPRGWRAITVVNNNYVGLLYIGTALLFFLLAGILALLMRAQLAVPDNDLIGHALYNQLFTMH